MGEDIGNIVYWQNKRFIIHVWIRTQHFLPQGEQTSLKHNFKLKIFVCNNLSEYSVNNYAVSWHIVLTCGYLTDDVNAFFLHHMTIMNNIFLFHLTAYFYFTKNINNISWPRS